MANELICRIVTRPDGYAYIEDEGQLDKQVVGVTKQIPKDIDIAWQNQLKEDMKYPTATPINGKYFTFRVYDEDTEVPKKVAEYIAGLAYTEWEYELNFRVEYADASVLDKDVDFKLYFVTPQTDPNMTSMTLAYHYYWTGIRSPTSGVCKINKIYYYTIFGKPISLGIIDKAHYKPDEKKRGKTYNLVKILRHEFGHGLVGLPHTSISGHTMSSSYEHMSEWLTAFDILRGVFKYGAKKWKHVNVKAKVIHWYRTLKSKNLPDELKPLVDWD